MRKGILLAIGLAACGEAETSGLLPYLGSTPDTGGPTDGGAPFDSGVPPGRRDGGSLDGATPPDVGPAPECSLGEVQACNCPSGAEGRASCRADLTFGGCRCPNGTEGDTLSWLRDGVVGDWEGTMITPWIEPYRVEISFFADGRYSARAIDAPTVAFYYGSDEDHPSKRYELFDVYADDSGRGWIDIHFGSGSVLRDDLERIRLDERQDELRFDFFHVTTGRYGPIEATLHRRRR